MRASEKSHFRLPRMHLLLAASSLALVVVTVLLLRADHQRPWKQYQRTFQQRIVPWLARSRSAQLACLPAPPESPRQTAKARLPGAQARSFQPTGASPGDETEADPDTWTRRVLEWPFVEALARPLRIEQIVLPELPLDYHFCLATRFDRCTTCHRAIGLAAWDDPARPALPVEQQLLVELAPRSTTLQATLEGTATTVPGKPPQSPLQAAGGLRLAEQGILDPNAPTIECVVPGSPAALAGLTSGDVIEQINGRPAGGRGQAEQVLLEELGRRQPVRLLVRRGLAHPFAGHPRLDLYVSPSSPHPAERFGCTICHGGQGAATDFVGAAHTPNSSAQQAHWRAEYGWVREHDWEQPMLARRFLMGRCVQCHQEPLELDVLQPFPAGRQRVASTARQVRKGLHIISLSDPPALQADRPHPRPLTQRKRGDVVDVVAGYRLVRTYGCFGCHDIRGHDATGRAVGPDMTLEPSDASAVGQLSAGAAVRAGDLRKVGPSLRGLAGRLDAAYLIDRLRDPRAFLPATRMPRQYGLHEHLDPESRALARRLEAVEIRAVAEYLLAANDSPAAGEASRPADDLPVMAAASAERGKTLLQLRGCLACHQHRDFSDGGGSLGPDLSHLAAKYATPEGRQWLVQWIRDPAGARAGSLMPGVPLNPLDDQQAPDSEASAGPPPAGRQTTDPAADLAAYLLASARETTWPPPDLPPLAEGHLDELVACYLRRRFAPEEAERFAREGIPRERAEDVSADEAVLLGAAGVREKLLYVGRRSIARRGCFGCHDIPGFESARPIGPELSKWGRKRVEELAFEHVGRWLQRGEAAAPAASRQSTLAAPAAPAAVPGEPAARPQARPDGEALGAFYVRAVAEQRREGFAWQKLRRPRSFDYEVAARKDYLDWLTMGRFEFTPAEREQIVAFLLSLTADPPRLPYVFEGTPGQQALVAGRELIERYACAECHTLRMERWTLDLLPGAIGPAPERPEYDFLVPRVSAQRRAASLAADRRGLTRAVVVGMPRVDAWGRVVEDEDAEGNPLYYFTLWQPALINGHLWPVGGPDLMISSRQIRWREPPLGGRLARWLYPAVLARMRSAGLAGAESAAWASLPPPLVDEGTKVRAEWLYQYLLDPVAIRPGAVMHMPRYHLAPDQAQRLADYFGALAASDSSDVSFSSDVPRFASREGSAAAACALAAAPRPGLADEQDRLRLERAQQAMGLLIDRTTYCAKCHVIGDYRPGGVQTTLAPDLTSAGGRLRGDYLYRWLAHPQTVLPYTAMPVNFPPEGGPLDARVFPGTSREQLDAVVDLLLNYEWYLKQQTSVRGLMEQPIEGPESAQRPGNGG